MSGTTEQRNPAATVVLVIIIFALGVVVFGAGVAGVNVAKPPDVGDPLANWCRGHTGHLPGNSGAVAELAAAKRDPLLRQGIASVWGGSMSFAPVVVEGDGPSTTPPIASARAVDEKYAPDPVKDLSHRYGKAIVAALNDPKRLDDPQVLEDAQAIDAWAKANCTRPEDQAHEEGGTLVLPAGQLAVHGDDGA